MDWLLECYVNTSCTDLKLRCPNFPPRPLLKVPELQIPTILKGSQSFPLTLPLVIFQPFFFLNPPHELVHVLEGSHSQ